MEIEKEETCEDKNSGLKEILLNFYKELEITNLSGDNENLAKYSLIQFIQFLFLINTNNYFQDLYNSPFYSVFSEMKQDPLYHELIQNSLMNSQLSLHNLKNQNFYINKKISQNLARKLKVLFFKKNIDNI